MAPPEPPEPDVTAAELALGLLEGDARAAALRRMLAEPDYAGEVQRWRGWFELLFAEVPEVAPPPALAARIAASARLADRAPAALRTWRTAAVGAGALAAGLLALLLVRPALPVAPPPQVAAAPAPALFLAVLAPKGDAPIAAVYDRDRAQVRLTGSALSPADKAAQLWIIPADGTPRALGLLRADVPTTLTITPTLRGWLVAGATLAISIEPRGGSPTGLPTGPVVATGALSRT